MDVLDAIQNRRSIRRYKPDPVDDKTLQTVLNAARLAPSWDNSQCWKFIIVKDHNTKAQLADTIKPHPQLGINPAQKAFKAAPIVIVALAEKKISGYFQGRSSSEKENSWYMFDVALAMENLVLAATALGLGTVHVGLFDDTQVASILGIPDRFHVVEMTPLGYPEFQPRQRPRKDISEVVFYERFGRNSLPEDPEKLG